MLLFALTRAARDPRIRRIVVVLPYLSILDQTVDTYRKVFPEKTFSDGYILEHHSLAGTHSSEEQSRVARALTQNWDAPIIITTSVQLLESLHAAHPGTCRKLHRLAGSVVMLDEIQTLPAKLAVTTLKTLSRLASDRYGSVVVLATATQPAFEALDAQVTAGEPGNAGWAPREIVPAQAQLYTLARRVKVNWHLENPTSWDDVAAWTEERERVMTIVNLKAHAALLIDRLRGTPGLAHVSTSLCPAHRRVVLQDVRYRMSGSGPCRVVATQCLEAGVELDFPLVIRAVAPYDAVTQAGGRCNRHGLLLFGELRVFLPEDERYPGDGQRRGREQKGQYNRGAQMTRALQREAELAGTELDLDDPATFHRYYRRLLQYTSADDRTLQDAIRRHDFPLVAEHYRLIDQGAVNVVVPYGEGVHLIDEALHEGIDAGWIRRAQPYSVSVFQRRNNALPDFCAEVSVRETGSQNGLRRLETAEQWRVCVQPDAYDSSLMGLRQSDHPDSLTD